MATWLVERYWPGVRTAEVEAAAARLRAATPADGVCYLGSTYLPVDDTVLCLFEAAAAEQVVALNAAAGVALDRVGPAVLVGGVRPGGAVRPDPGAVGDAGTAVVDTVELPGDTGPVSRRGGPAPPAPR